jgi:cellulose synthase/poly-beta-1,6-N-acetylglucosamine synthase-like glycosyltransferase
MTDGLGAVLFWVPVALTAYHWLIFPQLLWLVVRLRPGTFERPAGTYQPTVTVAVAAHNEELCIADKIRNCLEFTYPSDKLEILIGSDASDDATDSIVRQFESWGVKLRRLPERGGKVKVLNLLIGAAAGELILFTDADTWISSDSLARLARRFADPKIGVVQCHYQRTGNDGSVAEGIFDRFETRLKRLEGEVGATVNADGWALMVRKSACAPLPEDTICDDFVMNVRPFRLGYYAAYEPGALVMTRVEPEQAEFGRRVRNGRGHMQDLVRQRDLLSPRYGLRAWVLFSHVTLRSAITLLQPLILLGCALQVRSPFFAVLLAVQLAVYATTPLLFCARGRWRRVLLPQYYVLISAALMLGCLDYIIRPGAAPWKRTRRENDRPT